MQQKVSLCGMKKLTKKRIDVNSQPGISSIDKQREFLDYLFMKFKCNTLDDITKIPVDVIIKNGGEKLFSSHSKKFSAILKTVYPNYCWKSEDEKQQEIYSKQRKLLEKFATKLKLKSRDEYAKITINQFKTWGKTTQNLLSYYNDDTKKLLTTLYPSHDWKFEEMKIYHKKEYFKSRDIQIEFMDNLFYKLNYLTLSDFLLIPKNKIFEHGGYSLLTNYYDNDIKKLLVNLYPNYPWKIDFYLLKTKEEKQKKNKTKK